MRLISHGFLFLGLLLTASPAIGQPGTSYAPPPVDYADAPAPVAAPAPDRADDAGVSYAPPPVDYVEPGNAVPQGAPAAQPLLQPEAQVDTRQPRRRRVDVGAYVALNVGAETGDLLGNDDTLTYSSVAAGVEGAVQTRSVTASFGYRYERNIELSGNAPDRDTHSGIAQVRAELVPNTLSVEAAGLAARTGGSGRALGATRREPGAQIVTAYAGPELNARAGALNVNAYYRLGYTHVDDDTLAGGASNDGSFSATTHVAGASIGRAAGNGSIGWGVSAGHVSEAAGPFRTHTSIQYARADVTVPVNPTLALTGGVGYARERGSERDFLRGPGGAPVLDGNGELIPDPTRPRVRTLDFDGIYGDVGFIYRPTPRSELELHVGVNDKSDPVVYGQAHAQVGRAFGVSVTVYDNDETFGSSLQRNLRSLPGDFQVRTDPLTGNLYTGCVFSRTDYGRGVCLSPALQSLTTASYRNRGGSVLWSGGRRLWTIGGGVTYNRRDFYRGDSPLLADYFAPSDEDLSLFASAGRRLGRTSDLGLSAFASFYGTDDIGADDVTTLGARATYSRSFLLNRLQGVLAVGLTHRSYSISPETLSADVLLGLTYTF